MFLLQSSKLLDASEAGPSCSRAKNAEVTSPRKQPQASRWDAAPFQMSGLKGYGFPENMGKTQIHHPGKVSERLDNLQVAPHQQKHPEYRLPPACASGTPGRALSAPAPPTHLDVSGERGRGPEERQEQPKHRTHGYRHHPPPPERNCGRSAPAGTHLARPRPRLEWQLRAPIERRRVAAPLPGYQPMGRRAWRGGRPPAANGCREPWGEQPELGRGRSLSPVGPGAATEINPQVKLCIAGTRKGRGLYGRL